MPNFFFFLFFSGRKKRSWHWARIGHVSIRPFSQPKTKPKATNLLQRINHICSCTTSHATILAQNVSVCVRERRENLSAFMPVNGNSLGVKLVSEFHNNGVSGFSPDSRSWKLAIYTHHNMFQTILRPVHVFHFPFEMPSLGTQWNMDQRRHNAPENKSPRAPKTCNPFPIWKTRMDCGRRTGVLETKLKAYAKLSPNKIACTSANRTLAANLLFFHTT